ncbi:MAG: anthranilate/aminodeoxychorismate synthase component II [Candidatus Dadabacteria bacterium]|nr:anthranilate/aminodeoxychorismate synthase component II [Candidatus Dadabacteria bacterium]NIQ17059.1 anthranilate/aminodeoxychorismate synthase component II [Candidatus Dadabacteria bacterium]
MILMIDNYDSFTYNLVHYLGEFGEKVEVYRNDQLDFDTIDKINPESIVISPGPCTPKEAGSSVDIIKKYSGKKPILGVCLGHQSIAYAYGANIIRADRLLHGKTSPIYHDNRGVFENLPNPFDATRYHSLVVERESLSDEFDITAWTKEGEIMGIKHKTLPIEGVQFHPESVLTKCGKELLKNFLILSKNYTKGKH